MIYTLDEDERFIIDQQYINNYAGIGEFNH